ncbi:helix-turn-helix domain-containing protein [Tamlana fucoidanivorans]|uniref:Helix-turn-helix domain-containing protein n=1 Tax=Allotamlana fucoidanivorans TaxID=2583814 RepID=A0A5C4SNF3_9FLAO|nr:helix-turn-helix domain-containing protein [Tamlana fucoidanivorans]TNJ45271.1 helix-turn-helix domain-containing protein [Tamlana fucoidanivorans]
MNSQSSLGQSFVERLNNILEENYHDENFGVNDLASNIGVSRSQLHRKLKRLNGVSTSQYIKIFRLQKGYELLKDYEKNVSEVAYAVGFNSPSYFTKCFQQHYKCSPGELKHKTENIHTNAEINLNRNTKKAYFQLGTLKLRSVHLGVLFFIALGIGVFYFYAGNTKTQKPKSIAILPLKVNSNLMDSDVLSEGIHDGLTKSLGQINQFNVLSRATTVKYKNSSKTKAKIIKELGVDFIVSGEVYYSDNDSMRLNITINKVDGVNAGSINYNTSLEHIVSIQNLVAQKIAKLTGMPYVSENQFHSANHRVVNTSAYKNYIRGMYYLHKSSQEDFDKGLQFLYKALDDDPAEPLAYAGLAYGYVILGHSASQNKDVFEKALMAANRAIELDTSLLEAYAAIASIHIYHDRNWYEAEKLFDYLLTKNPSMANVHYDYSWYCLLVGDRAKALQHHELAEKLDPLNAKYIAWSGWMLAYYGDYKGAMEKVERALEIAPNNAIAYLAKGFIYRQQNDFLNAKEAYGKLYENSPGMVASLGGIYAEMGDFEKANEIIEQVNNWPNSPWKNWSLAVLYAQSNQAEMAVKMLEKEPKHAFVAWAAVVPAFDKIKDHKDFKTFASNLKIPVRNNQNLLVQK